MVRQRTAIKMAVSTGRYEIMGSDEEKGPLLCSQRWILAYMGLLLGLISNVIRANMSVAIVCMVKTSPSMNQSNSQNYSNIASNHRFNGTTLVVPLPPSNDNECSQLGVNDRNQKSLYEEGEFDWDKTSQSMVLAAFYYGYVICQIPGGWLSRRYGGKRVTAICVATQAVATLLVPVLSRLSFYGLIVIRVIIGICSGASAPSIFDLFGVWALPSERSRFVTLFWFGRLSGTFLGNASTGFLCVHGFDHGWGSVFYVHGGAGVMFVLLWVFTVYGSPAEHPRITENEFLQLQHQLSSVSQEQRKHTVPWGKILRYVPAWAIFLTHICENWTFILLSTCLPLFIKEVLKYDTQRNGIFSSLPSISSIVGHTLAGVAADKVITATSLTITATRKLFTIIGFIGAAVFVVVAGYITCDKREFVIVAFCLCLFFLSFVSSAGFLCNHVEIAPRYGTIIVAMSNTLAALPGMVLPFVAVHLTQNNTRREWLTVFYITAGFTVLGMLIYTALADSQQAPWADSDTDKEENIEPEEQELRALNKDINKQPR